MRVKLGELINCGRVNETNGNVVLWGLAKILAQDLPLKIQYRFIRLNEEAESELKRFQSLQRKMFDKWGEPETVPVLDEDGTPKLDNEGKPVMENTGNMKIKSENVQEYNNEIVNLLNEEIEIWYEPVSINDLESVKLNKADYDMIKPFIVDKS